MKSLIDTRERAAVMDRLRRLRPDSARRWGRMSAHQMICHLADSTRMALGERVVSPHGWLFHRTFLKWGALYVPLRWPRGFPARPEIDQAIAGTAPTEFDRDRAELERLVDRFCERVRPFGTHPIFGPLTFRQWMRWGYLHMDHHCRQFGL